MAVKHQYESEKKKKSKGKGSPESGVVGTDREKREEKVRQCQRPVCACSYLQAATEEKELRGSEYHDLTDPFIDDLELAIDERTFIAQPKQHGFHVFSGKVALLKEKAHRNLLRV